MNFFKKWISFKNRPLGIGLQNECKPMTFPHDFDFIKTELKIQVINL